MPPAVRFRVTATERKNDYKFDVRLSKFFMTAGRLRAGHRGVQRSEYPEFLDYNGVVTASSHLQPSSSTDVFYQPRQLQFAFRVLY